MFAPTKYLDGIHLEEHRIDSASCRLRSTRHQAEEGMKLKEYQERTLKEVKGFLEQLVVWRGKAREGDEWLFDFAEKAWDKAAWAAST